MKSRVDLIRDEEKRYHDYCYVNRQEYNIKRNERQILLTGDVVTIVARKM